MEQKLKEYTTVNVGDRVKIIPESRYYLGGPDESNPKDVEGTVLKPDGSWIRVRWDNGKENGYEEYDLTVLGNHERIYYDENKIYLSREPKSVKDIFNIIYPKDDIGRAQETYSKSIPDGKVLVQCQKGRMRSFDDFYIIADTYFPGVDPAVVFKEMLLFNLRLDDLAQGHVPKQLSNCSTMQRIRFTNSRSTLYAIWASVDCNKYQSIYKWRDLFNMIHVNSLDQLKNWYTRELTAKEEEIKAAKEAEKKAKLVIKPKKSKEFKKVVLESVIPLSLRSSTKRV